MKHLGLTILLISLSLSGHSIADNGPGTSAYIKVTNTSPYPLVVSAISPENCIWSVPWADGLPLSSGSPGAPSSVGPLVIVSEGGDDPFRKDCSETVSYQSVTAQYTYPNGTGFSATCLISLANGQNLISCNTASSGDPIVAVADSKFTSWQPASTASNPISITINSLPSSTNQRQGE